MKKQLQSDRGFYNQLLATWYWLNVLPVLGIEQNINGHDIDILSELDGRTLKIHVKTLDQWEKGNLVFTATAHIWQVLGKHICQNTGKPLGIAAFDGVVPPGLEVSDWERLLENVPREPGIHSIAVDEKHSVVLELAYTTE